MVILSRIYIIFFNLMCDNIIFKSRSDKRLKKYFITKYLLFYKFNDTKWYLLIHNCRSSAGNYNNKLHVKC